MRERAFLYSWLIAILCSAASAQKEPVFGLHRFEDFPAKLYRGSIAKPDFVHGRRFRIYRTMIRSGTKNGANFAGHYATITIGCGQGCSLFYLVDVRSGKIFDVPMGGERLYATQLVIRPNSRLIKAWSTDLDKNDDHICRSEERVFDGRSFRRLWHSDTPGECAWD